MKKFFSDFKDFAVKGNLMDLAVAVVIGGAFGKIVTSFVNDIIMPLLGIVAGQASFANLSGWIGAAQIKYGAFLQAIFDFIIIALSIFVFVKLINNARKKIEEIAKIEKVQEEVIAVTEIELLTEIRDLLKSEK